MNFKQMQEDVFQNRTGCQHVIELLQGDAGQFTCEPNEEELSTFTITNKARHMHLRVSIFLDNHAPAPVDVLISSTECESDYFKVPYLVNTNWTAIIAAVLI